MSELITKRKLNNRQVEILELLYKFRFGSNNLIAEHFGKKDRSFVYNRLKILQLYGLIGKRFDKSYRIKGKPAAYFLLPDGARELMKYKPEITINLKGIYNENSRSELFIHHCLDIFAIANQLKLQFSENLKYFPKSTLANYDYFPKPSPDAYIAIKAGNDTHRIFMEMFDETMPPFAVDRRLRQLIEYYQSGEWQTKGSPFPLILCVCESGGIEKRLQKQIRKAMFRSGEEGIQFISTSIKALLISEKYSEIWSDSVEPNKLFTMEFLLSRIE